MAESKKKGSGTLAGRMKKYESAYDHVIKSTDNMIIRLDGHKFSKFTKKYFKNKPYDERFGKIMKTIAAKMLRKYGAETVYTQSDEITLYFPAIPSTQNGRCHIHNGRISKLASLTAGYATALFNDQLLGLHASNRGVIGLPEGSFKEAIGEAYFDARVFGISEDYEVINAFLFRTRDAERNSKQSLGHYLLGKSRIHKVSANGVAEIVAIEKGIVWDDFDSHYKWGTFMKMKTITTEREVDGVINKYSQSVPCEINERLTYATGQFILAAPLAPQMEQQEAPQEAPQMEQPEVPQEAPQTEFTNAEIIEQLREIFMNSKEIQDIIRKCQQDMQESFNALVSAMLDDTTVTPKLQLIALDKF